VVNEAKRIVVKVGTSTLTHHTGMLNIRRVEELVKVLADLKNAGKDVVLVTSGAIGVGAGKLLLPERPKDMPTKQACAALGQCELMYIYDKYFAEYNHNVAQVLLTRDIIEDDVRKEHVVNTLCRLLELSIIPVINENDTVSVEEIEFGDNDTLSAIVADLVSADLLVILSDIDGLFDKNPKQYPDAELIPEIHELTPEIYALAGGKGSEFGTGGMLTKLHAADVAMKAKIPMVIMNGESPRKLYELFDGKPVGTLFEAR
jgi:glutamate 5-kinase